MLTGDTLGACRVCLAPVTQVCFHIPCHIGLSLHLALPYLPNEVPTPPVSEDIKLQSEKAFCRDLGGGLRPLVWGSRHEGQREDAAVREGSPSTTSIWGT